jgi:hypothetical protein
MQRSVWTGRRDRSAKSRHRAWVVALTGLFFLPASALVGGVPPAQAASCSAPLRTASSPVASTSFAWDPMCSDGYSHIYFADLTDENCDARGARVRFRIYRRSTGAWVATSSNYQNNNGCGSTATLPDIRLNSAGEGNSMLYVELYAANAGGSSSVYVTTFYG